jgi:hypothetical protein
MAQNRPSSFALDPAATDTATDDRRQRLAKEAQMLEDARQELRDGKGLTGEALKTWLDDFVKGKPQSQPKP